MFVVYVIIFIAIIIGLATGAFNNQPYTNKYAKKKATDVKIMLEHIRKAESFTNIDDIIAYYSTLVYDYRELANFKELNNVAFEQVTSMALSRYQTIHQERLNATQTKFLQLSISLNELYAECLIKVFSQQVEKIKAQIESLKTDAAKRKRYDLIKYITIKAKDDLNNKGLLAYTKRIDDISSIIPITYDVKDMALDILVNSIGINIKKGPNVVDDSSEEKYTSPKIMNTDSIIQLLKQISKVGKKENQLWREGYKTIMPSMDFTNFIKSCLKNNDLESIYQYLCLYNNWEYNRDAYRIYGYTNRMFLNGLKQYYKRPYEIEDAMKDSSSTAYILLLQRIREIYPNLDAQEILSLLIPGEYKDKERLSRLIDTDFSRYVRISDECRMDLLSVFIRDFSDDSFYRGFFNVLSEDCPADKFTYAFTIYDFNVIDTSVLVSKANFVLKDSKEMSDYYEDRLDFADLPPAIYTSPVGDELRNVLRKYGVTERYYLLHLIYEKGYNEPDYQTKQMGINENDAHERFVRDELIVRNEDTACLLLQGKNDLLHTAEHLGVMVRKSWTKEKIYNAIVADTDKQKEIGEIVSSFGYYKVNPKYETEFSKLIEYRKEIAPLMHLLFFA